MSEDKTKDEKIEEKPTEEKAEEKPTPKVEEQSKEEKKEEASKEEAKPEESPKEEQKVEENPKEAPKKEKKPVKKECKLKTSLEKKNPLMKRTEYMIQIVHNAQATPTRIDLTKELVKFLKVKEDVILIEKILSERGKSESIAKIFVYKDKKDIPKHKLEKITKRMGKKTDTPAEKSAEAPKQPLENEPLKKVQSKIETTSQVSSKEEASEEKPKEEEKAEETEKT